MSPLVLSAWSVPTRDWDPDAFPVAAFLLAERPAEVTFSRLGDARGFWEAGHIFASRWHFQFLHLGDHYRVVGLQTEVISEVSAVTASWKEPAAVLDVRDAVTTSYTIGLWGQRQPEEEEWLELRIPHFMQAPTLHPADHYPGEAPVMMRRALQVVRYQHPQTHAILFDRFTNLTYQAAKQTA